MSCGFFSISNIINIIINALYIFYKVHLIVKDTRSNDIDINVKMRILNELYKSDSSKNVNDINKQKSKYALDIDKYLNEYFGDLSPLIDIKKKLIIPRVISIIIAIIITYVLYRIFSGCNYMWGWILFIITTITSNIFISKYENYIIKNYIIKIKNDKKIPDNNTIPEDDNNDTMPEDGNNVIIPDEYVISKHDYTIQEDDIDDTISEN